MKLGVAKSCPKCDGFLYAGGVTEDNMPDDYCPTCKEHCCELKMHYDKDGSIVILDELSNSKHIAYGHGYERGYINPPDWTVWIWEEE